MSDTLNNPAGSPSLKSDTQALMAYDANKRSVLVAYLLWLFLGWAGAHRFYLRRTGSAAALLALFVGGVALAIVGVGFVLLLVNTVWWFVDAFLIPGIARDFNNRLAGKLGGTVLIDGDAYAPVAASPRYDAAIDAALKARQAGSNERTRADSAGGAPRGFGKRTDFAAG